MASKSFESISILLTLSSRWVPALPGQTKTCFTKLSCAHFHANACSLPPEPITRIFFDFSFVFLILCPDINKPFLLYAFFFKSPFSMVIFINV